MYISDIEIAKQKLIDDDLKICIVKDERIIYSSKLRGIFPMYTVVSEGRVDLKGASVADRVIGRAAGMLNVYSGIKCVYGEVMSENAVKLLEENNISVEYKLEVPFIKNRNKDDLCPVEKLSNKIEDSHYEKLLDEIQEFLVSVGMIEGK